MNTINPYKRHTERKKITPPFAGIGKEIEELLEQTVISLYPTALQAGEKLSIGLSWTDNSTHGDYTSTLALRLAKALKRSPLVIATEIVNVLMTQKRFVEANVGDQNTTKHDQMMGDPLQRIHPLQAIQSIQVVPPGYINVYLENSCISTQLFQVLEMKDRFGAGDLKKDKKIMVEFTDPNPFKEFHIGHLYSNAVGESISRLLESQGAAVKRANYFGDVGMHVAKSLYGLLAKFEVRITNNENNDYIQVNKQMDELEKKLLPERIKFLGQCYALGATKFEESDEVKEVMKRINLLVFITAQEYMRKTFKFEPQVDYTSLIQSITETEKKVIWELFSRGREWSMEYFETIYKRLGTKFDFYYPESNCAEYGVKMVRSHIKDGVFEQSDGAVVYKGEKHGLHTRVFINALGLPTYETKDLGNAVWKYKDFPYDESYNVTGNEINDYFDVLLAALSEFEPELSQKTMHIGHGMVRLPTGKMSSRTGKIVTGEWLLDESKRIIKEKMESSKYKVVPDKDIDVTADVLAVAAVKYALLRSSIGSDVVFDFDTSISVEGDSGPYLVYTYARCKSIMRKFKEQNPKFKASLKSKVQSNNTDRELDTLNLEIDWNVELKTLNFNQEERLLARTIMQFSDIISSAAINLSPSAVCTYLYDLAQVFNNFYTKHQILKIRSTKHEARNNEDSRQSIDSDFGFRISNFRIFLTEATAHVLHNGLQLLGIQTVEQM